MKKPTHAECSEGLVHQAIWEYNMPTLMRCEVQRGYRTWKAWQLNYDRSLTYATCLWCAR